MVLCLVVGCSRRTGQDKDVSFYRLPRVITSRGKQGYELNKKRRARFLVTISRDHLTKTKLENDRICSRHFVFGKLAYLMNLVEVVNSNGQQFTKAYSVARARAVVEDYA